MAKLPVFTNHFGPQQAERLLWRAGFGPRPGDAAELAKKGLQGGRPLAHATASAEQLTGPAPTDRGGGLDDQGNLRPTANSAGSTPRSSSSGSEPMLHR